MVLAATGRLKKLQSHLSTETVSENALHQLLVILPDSSGLYYSTQANETAIYESDSQILSFFELSGPPIALELASVGTVFEGKASHLPKYPIQQVKLPPSVTALDLWKGIYGLFVLFGEQENIPIALLTASEGGAVSAKAYILKSGLGRTSKVSSRAETEWVIFLSRSAFWQGAGTIGWHNRGWIGDSVGGIAPGFFPCVVSFTRIETAIASHPLRPQKPNPGQLLYRRWCTKIGQFFELVYFDTEGLSTGDTTVDGVKTSKHLECFHRWHNTEFVNNAWGEQGSVEEHIQYIKKVASDPNVWPCIMLWDGIPMGYTEIVWVKENHVANHYPLFGAMNAPGDWDRGIHVLVGEETFRGSLRAETWLRSLVHFIFLADPRTTMVIGEPKESNKAIIKVGQNAGFHHQTTFDFPYKRSVLLINPRERFFLSPLY